MPRYSEPDMGLLQIQMFSPLQSEPLEGHLRQKGDQNFIGFGLAKLAAEQRDNRSSTNQSSLVQTTPLPLSGKVMQNESDIETMGSLNPSDLKDQKNTKDKPKIEKFDAESDSFIYIEPLLRPFS